jgi:hypothetical protein
MNDNPAGPARIQYRFHLHLTSLQCLEYYRGEARHVVALATNGQTVRFPANLLQRFVTQDGIEGDFVLTCDTDHKNARLERV